MSLFHLIGESSAGIGFSTPLRVIVFQKLDGLTGLWLEWLLQFLFVLKFPRVRFLFCHFYSFVPILVFRCDLGSCNRDVASRRLSNPSWYRHGDCFSRRHPDEDVEDVDPATHHLQFNHRCSCWRIVSMFSYIMVSWFDDLIFPVIYWTPCARSRYRAGWFGCQVQRSSGHQSYGLLHVHHRHCCRPGGHPGFSHPPWKPQTERKPGRGREEWWSLQPGCLLWFDKEPVPREPGAGLFPAGTWGYNNIASDFKFIWVISACNKLNTRSQV